MKKKVKFFIGTRNLSEDKGKLYRAKTIHFHPKRVAAERAHRRLHASSILGYEPYAGPYDIALIKLAKFVPFKKNKVIPFTHKKDLQLHGPSFIQVGPICLFDINPKDFSHGYVAGFGSTNFADICWTSKRGPNPFMQCKPRFNIPYSDKLYKVHDMFITLYGIPPDV